MRPLLLLHFAAVVLVTTAAPLLDIPDDSDHPSILHQRGSNKNIKSSSNRKSKAAGQSTPVQFNLFPFVNTWDMAHGLTMASESTGTSPVPASRMQAASIPPDLKFVKGNFRPTLSRSTLTVSDQVFFEEAKTMIASSNIIKKTHAALKHYGEKAIEVVASASLINPTNSIFAAITGSRSLIHWDFIGAAVGPPVPDIILRVKGRKSAVIEVKTTTVLTDTEIDGIMADYTGYSIQTIKSIPTLVAAGTSLKMANSDRSIGTDIVEQVGISVAELTVVAGTNVHTQGLHWRRNEPRHMDRLGEAGGRPRNCPHKGFCLRRREEPSSSNHAHHDVPSSSSRHQAGESGIVVCDLPAYDHPHRLACPVYNRRCREQFDRSSCPLRADPTCLAAR